MRLLLLISLLSLGLQSYAEEDGIEFLPSGHWIVSDTVNKNLKPTEAKVKFRIQNGGFVNPDFTVILKTSVNGVWKDMKVDKDASFSYKLEPGKYRFQFYVNNAFHEMTIEEINVLPQHDVLIELNFAPSRNSGPEIIVDKPVIYLSSDVPTDFSINVKPNGKFTFTYPEIQAGWSGTCDATGQIQIDGKQYPYLFWESSQEYKFRQTTNGYRVSKTGVLSFLEQRCEELGLSSTEKTDFITYWGPRMMQFDELFVQFHLNEDCNQFATMEITPHPENVNRVYIAIAEWNSSFEPFLTGNTLPKVKRGGFTVVEWGGFEFSMGNLIVYNH